jgi:hypothetical protein
MVPAALKQVMPIVTKGGTEAFKTEFSAFVLPFEFFSGDLEQQMSLVSNGLRCLASGQGRLAAIQRSNRLGVLVKRTNHLINDQPLTLRYEATGP